MSIKKFNISVIVENTHSLEEHYYGEARDLMNINNNPEPQSIQFIRNCIIDAQRGHQGGDNACGTIIIFPEFILQPYEGAYTKNQKNIVINYMNNILQGTPNNVLIIFGTIVYEGNTNNEFCNDMFYGIGGANLQHTGKDLLSDIDLINSDFLATSIGWEGEILKKNPNLPNNWNQSPNQNHTINFQEQRIGFSICLDYYEGLLINNAIDPVDIHIVASCGMKFIDSNKIVDNRRFGDINFCNNKGKVIICDAEGTYSSVHQVNKFGQSKQKSSMLTTEFVINNQSTKIRRTQISMSD